MPTLIWAEERPHHVLQSVQPKFVLFVLTFYSLKCKILSLEHTHRGQTKMSKYTSNKKYEIDGFVVLGYFYQAVCFGLK